MFLRTLQFRRIIPSFKKILKSTTSVQNTIRCESAQLYISSCLINTHTKCMYSQKATIEALDVNYDYVHQATEDNNVLIVDVREPDEVKEHGKIPNSINIPLGTVTPVLSSMSENDFKKTFNREKPTPNTEIIFYCMIGKRSGKAQQNAVELGYKNAKNYVGSWNDWASKKQ